MKEWRKYTDTITGDPYWSFEGRIPMVTVSAIEVIITVDRRCGHNFYKGRVYHVPTEGGNETPEFNKLTQCKRVTEELFEEYCNLFPDDTAAL